MKFFAGITLAIFLGLMFVSLFFLSGAADMTHGMSSMSDCPLMADREIVCSMNLFEHMGTWKTLFSNLIPSALTFLLAVGAAVFIATTAPYLQRRPIFHLRLIHWYQQSRNIYSDVVRAFQELFSSGILHPKVF